MAFESAALLNFGAGFALLGFDFGLNRHFYCIFQIFIGLITLQPTYRELLCLCAMNPRAERQVLLHYSHRYFTESFIFALFKTLSRALYGEKGLLFVQGFGVIEPALGIAQQTGMPALLAMIHIFGQI